MSQISFASVVDSTIDEKKFKETKDILEIPVGQSTDQ